MAYDAYLEDRIEQILREKKVIFVAKKMMGGLTFMVDNKMCVGIVKNDLMARVGPDAYDAALRKEGCKEMNFTDRPLRGYVFVEPYAVDLDVDLEYWVELCLDYNPLAKSSKKNK